MRTYKTHFTFLIFLISSISTSFAFDFEYEGIFFNILSEENHEVGVTNNMNSGTANSNTSYSGEIVIPSSVVYKNKKYDVTSIQNYAFGGPYAGCKITKIEIPSSVKYIEESAFENCQSLKEISGGDNIISIGDNAFFSCSVLKNFNFGGNLVSIGKQAFCNCYSLTDLILKDSLVSIEEKAFYYCTNIKNIIFGKAIGFIDSYAFSYCSALTDVFFTSASAPFLSPSAFSGIKAPSLYVPSSEIYGFGTDYVTFSQYSFQYSGKVNAINFTNNVRFLQCSLSQSQTEKNAGDYSDKITAAYSGNLNFKVEVPYNYTITKKPLLVRVNNAERKYGEENPVFSSVAIGFVNDENFSDLDQDPVYLCSATPASKIGNYLIVPVIYTKNYEVTAENGTLTVSPALLTVKAEDAHRLYGEENPVFSLKYEGFVNHENENVLTKRPVATTIATKTSPVGEYPIVVGGGEALNYVFDYINGTLHITSSNEVTTCEMEAPFITVTNCYILIHNKKENEICRIYDLTGKLVKETRDSVIEGLNHGIYFVNLGNQYMKIVF